MPDLTAEQHNRYLATRGMRCPLCESDETEEASPLERIDNRVEQVIRCGHCLSAWTDVYQLSVAKNVIACDPPEADHALES